MSSYVENNLGKDERVILKAKKSIFCIIPQAIFFVLVIIGYVVLSSELSKAEQAIGIAQSGGLSSYLWIVLILGALPLIIKLIVLWGMNLAVTNKRVIGKVGVLKIQALDYHIDKVDNVSLKAGLWGNVFRYQTVVVKGGGDSAIIKFKGIANANQFKNAVNAAIEKHAEEARKQQAAEIAKAMGK